MIEQATAECEKLQSAAEKAQSELISISESMDAESEEYGNVVSWAAIYDTCSFETKKMFVSQFIKSIRIYRDYRMEIEFNDSFEEFTNMEAEAEQ